MQKCACDRLAPKFLLSSYLSPCSSLFLSHIHHTEMSICVHSIEWKGERDSGESSDRSIDHQEKQPQHQGAIRTTKEQKKKKKTLSMSYRCQRGGKVLFPCFLQYSTGCLLSVLAQNHLTAKEHSERAFNVFFIFFPIWRQWPFPPLSSLNC